MILLARGFSAEKLLSKSTVDNYYATVAKNYDFYRQFDEDIAESLLNDVNKHLNFTNEDIVADLGLDLMRLQLSGLFVFNQLMML
jgi:hypothetical protein